MPIIGSTAIKHYFPDFPREPKDIDYVVNAPIKERVEGYEFLVNTVLYPLVKGKEACVHPDTLYTLKISHLFWNINWDKHMFDVQFLKGKGCKFDRELFDKLYIYWQEVHGRNKRSDLKMSAEDFFDNALDLEYEHDYLHTLLNPIPTYTKVLVDGAEVEVSEEKFNLLSYEDKCNLVYEEVELMSWERWPKWDFRIAYFKMLKKFIISHAPIWEALFIIDNYITLHKPRRNHFKIIENGIKQIKSNIE